MTWQEDLAARLLQLRRREGISQEELAEIAGVSRQAVSKWESAQSVPETEKLLAISEHFKVSLDWLLLGAEREQAQTPTQAEPRRAFNGRLALTVATLLIWCGLLVGWAVWDAYYTSFGTVVSLIAVAVAVAVFYFGIGEAAAAEKKSWQSRFWLFNIWPIVMLAESAAVSVMLSMSWLQPVWTEHLFVYAYGYMGGGGPFLVIGVWLVVCCTVAVGCYKNLH